MNFPHIYKNNKKMRCGFTTGSCATAATKAAALILLGKNGIKEVSLVVPSGIYLNFEILEITEYDNKVRCAVRKDSGDDPDVTNGILVYSTVSLTENDIFIDGGIGVGRITKAGLDQPIGAAAINSIPRKMIEKELSLVCKEMKYKKGLDVLIEIPEGVQLAKKTFNPRLGIEGGISVLGTTGIVEPMSEKALIDTIRTEVSLCAAEKNKILVATPGNYGETFLNKQMKLSVSYIIKCSNFIGDTIDIAIEKGFKSLLFVGHIGKMIKLGAGIMNTHSKCADGRMEILAASCIMAGGENAFLKRILQCVTTDEALVLLQEEKLLESTIKNLMNKIDFYISIRAMERIKIGVVVFSNGYGILGRTEKAEEIIEELKENN